MTQDPRGKKNGTGWSPALCRDVVHRSRFLGCFVFPKFNPLALLLGSNTHVRDSLVFSLSTPESPLVFGAPFSAPYAHGTLWNHSELVGSQGNLKER